jgi:hypothetical protein
MVCKSVVDDDANFSVASVEFSWTEVGIAFRASWASFSVLANDVIDLIRST